MLKAMYSFALLLMSILIFSCSEQSLNPNTSDDNTGNKINYLSKTSWNTSSVYNWDTYSWYDHLYGGTFTRSESNYDFSFDNYAYHLEYSRVGSGTYTNTVIINVNGTYCSQITWNNTDGYQNSRWLGWHSFSYNGVSMQLKIYVLEHYIPMEDWSEPRQVQVQVYDLYVAPDTPTGFNVSPTVHPDEEADPVLTWNQTADNDVTHVEVWRRNNNPITSYQLLTTISKSNTSYTDYSCNWRLPIGRSYWYKIRFTDATHNLYSSFTSEKLSTSL